MDPNYILVLIIGLTSFVTLLRHLRLRGAKGWGSTASVVLVGVIIAVYLWPHVAGLIGLSLWAFLMLLPSLLLRRMSRQLARQEYESARRLSYLLRLVFPQGGWHHHPEFLRALDLAKRGLFEQSDVLLDRIATADSPLQSVARLHQLRLRDEWPEIADRLFSRLNGLHGSAAASNVPMALRALGEAGRTEELLPLYDRFRSVVESSSMPKELRASCQLCVFAFAGHRNGVDELLANGLHYYPEVVKSFWQATTDLVAGDETARQRLEQLSRNADPLNRQMIEYRLKHPLPSRSSLSQSSLAIVEKVRSYTDQEHYYGLLNHRPHQRGLATRFLFILHVTVFLVEVFYGDSTNPQTLDTLGALNLRALEGEWWRIVSASLLHAGVWHLTFNMLGLYLFGPYVEYWLGGARFLLLYLFGAAGSMLFCLGDMYLFDSDKSLVGASGFVMALLGTYTAILWRAWRRERSPLLAQRLSFFTMLIAMQFIIDTAIEQISGEAHASGAAIGFLFGLLVHNRIPVHNRPATVEATPASSHPEA